MPPLKNAKHEAFAQALAKGETAEASYALAGYKPSRSAASRLSTNVNVQARIKEIAERSADLAEIDIARTLRELVRLGTSDVRKLFSENGSLIPISDLDDDTAAAVASVEVITKTLAPDADGNREVEYVHKLKLWDKNSALDKIAKHLGMFVERIEHTGKGGGPIQTATIDPGKLSMQAMAEILAARNAGSNE
jgi:phage terminase small subunit